MPLSIAMVATDTPGSRLRATNALELRAVLSARPKVEVAIAPAGRLVLRICRIDQDGHGRDALRIGRLRCSEECLVRR